MDAEITRLESQLEQLISLFETGKTELRSLRTRVATLEAENHRLAGKLDEAIAKLESVLDKLPEA